MQVRGLFIVLATVSAITKSAVAQTWTQTSAPTADWSSIATSADGTHLIAAAQYAGIYISSDSGTSWTRASSGLPGGSIGWNAVASSADGSKLVAAALGSAGGIFVSGNSGATWTACNAPKETWQCLASSANGVNLTAVALYDTSYPANPGPVYTSTNSGGSWKLDNVPTANWRTVVSSADGTRLVAMGSTGGLGPVYISTDAGRTWTHSSAPFVNWSSVTASADGSRLIACAYGGGLYTNWGTAWIQSSGLSLTNTLHVAASVDGTKLVLAAYNGGIYSTTNFGIIWTSNCAPIQKWGTVASSADGTKLVAVVFGGGVWTCQNAPSPATPSPQLTLTHSLSDLTLAWTVPATNFLLQQSGDLVSWENLTNNPVLNLTNLQNQVTLPPSSGNCFYRLKTP
jgi:hypothetical protein